MSTRPPELPVVHDPVFFLDYDGTLAPLTEYPMQAYARDEVKHLLWQLEARYPLWIVTGRHLRDLAVLLNLPLRAVGLHGVQEGHIGGVIRSTVPGEVTAAVEKLRQTVPTLDGVWIEDKEHTFAVHYHEKGDVAAIVDALRQWVSDVPEALQIVWGKHVVEPRPNGVHKGDAVQRITARHPGRTPVYMGDDTTDEDAFIALNEQSVTVKVGPGETAARYRLAGVDEVLAYLERYV